MSLVPVMSVLYSSMMQTPISADTCGSGDPSVILLQVIVLSQRPRQFWPFAQSDSSWHGVWGTTGAPASSKHCDWQAFWLVGFVLIPLPQKSPALMLLASHLKQSRSS